MRRIDCTCAGCGRICQSIACKSPTRCLTRSKHLPPNQHALSTIAHLAQTPSCNVEGRIPSLPISKNRLTAIMVVGPP